MKKSALFLIIIAGILWGTSGLFTNALGIFGFSSLQITAMRGAVAAILMLIFVLIKNPKLLFVPKKEIFFLFGSGISIFLTAFTYFASIKASSVSTAVILMYTAPVYVLIYSVLFLGEKLNTIKAICIFLMIAGCALVSGIVGGMKFSFEGILLGIAAGISYSAYNIFTKILTIHKVNALTISCYSFIIMGIIGLALCNPAEVFEITVKEPISLSILFVCLGLVTCFLPYVFYNFSLRDIPAGTATALGIIEPLSATLFSVAFLDEKLGLPLVVGMVLILVAVFVLARQKNV